MRHLVRGLSLLLFVLLAGCWLLLRQRQFLLAGFAIVCLVEFALSLRARARPPPASRDRSRIVATQVSCTEQDGAITVTLTGPDEGPAGAACVRLSRGSVEPAAVHGD